MELTIINNVYSMFGNFSNFVTKGEDFNQIFAGYESQTGKEKLPNGMEAPVLRYTKDSIGVTIRVSRIDIEFANRTPEYNAEEFLGHVVEIASAIFAKFPELKGARIAYNQTAFTPNLEGSTVAKLNQAFNATNVFGEEAKEISVRFNHIKNIQGEDINSIILCQDGRVTNNNTHQEQPVVFINTDINTVIFNTEMRFSFADAQKYLSDMILESKEKIAKLATVID